METINSKAARCPIGLFSALYFCFGNFHANGAVSTAKLTDGLARRDSDSPDPGKGVLKSSFVVDFLSLAKIFTKLTHAEASNGILFHTVAELVHSDTLCLFMVLPLWLL